MSESQKRQAEQAAQLLENVFRVTKTPSHSQVMELCRALHSTKEAVLDWFRRRHELQNRMSSVETSGEIKAHSSRKDEKSHLRNRLQDEDESLKDKLKQIEDRRSRHSKQHESRLSAVVFTVNGNPVIQAPLRAVRVGEFIYKSMYAGDVCFDLNVTANTLGWSRSHQGVLQRVSFAISSIQSISLSIPSEDSMQLYITTNDSPRIEEESRISGIPTWNTISDLDDKSVAQNRAHILLGYREVISQLIPVFKKVPALSNILRQSR